MYTQTGINKLCQPAHVHLLKFMYKRVQDKADVNADVGRTRLYDVPVLNVPFQNNETYRKSIIYRASTAWNSLPADKRNTAMFDSFKSMLKKKLQENII